MNAQLGKKKPPLCAWLEKENEWPKPRASLVEDIRRAYGGRKKEYLPRAYNMKEEEERAILRKGKLYMMSRNYEVRWRARRKQNAFPVYNRRMSRPIFMNF